MEAPLLGSSASLAWSKRWAPLPQFLMVLRWTQLPQVSTFGTTMNDQIRDNHAEYFIHHTVTKYPISMHQCMTIRSHLPDSHPPTEMLYIKSIVEIVASS